MFIVYVSDQQIVPKLPYPPQDNPSADWSLAISLGKGCNISGNFRLDLPFRGEVMVVQEDD